MDMDTAIKRQLSITFVGFDEETPINCPLSGKYVLTFAYVTIKDRLPVILTKVIDQIVRCRDELITKYGTEAEDDIKAAIGQLSRLKNEVQTNKPILPLESNASDVAIWNDYLRQLDMDGTITAWFTVPWLYSENYFYRRIQLVFETSTFLQEFDPFKKQKQEAYHAALSEFPAVTSTFKLGINKPALSRFTTAMKLSLWSNRCDLSLSNGTVDAHEGSVLTNIDGLSKNILTNDIENAFYALQKSSSKIIDIVHDNAAYELFVDLCLADELLNLGFANKIRLRVKKFPWYVSDVTKPDISWLLEQLQSDDFGETSARWTEHIESGRWEIIADQFWTLPFPYCEMKSRDPALYKDLSEASLVIFKGDLNYRKLIGDINWKYSTPFSEALQGFHPTHVLALRTIKADLVSGVSKSSVGELFKKDPLWMRTGEYAVIQFGEMVQ